MEKVKMSKTYSFKELFNKKNLDYIFKTVINKHQIVAIINYSDVATIIYDDGCSFSLGKDGNHGWHDIKFTKHKKPFKFIFR